MMLTVIDNWIFLTSHFILNSDTVCGLATCCHSLFEHKVNWGHKTLCYILRGLGRNGVHHNLASFHFNPIFFTCRASFSHCFRWRIWIKNMIHQIWVCFWVLRLLPGTHWFKARRFRLRSQIKMSSYPDHLRFVWSCDHLDVIGCLSY